MGAGGPGGRVESWLRGTAITHQRPGQPASLCALRSPPVPGHRPPALDYSRPPRGRLGWGRAWGSCVGKELLQAQWGKEVTRAGFLEEGSVEMSWTEGETREGEWLWAKGRKNAVGLQRQGAECRGGGEGRTCKVSIQPPVGESWRGWERGATSCYEGYFGA